MNFNFTSQICTTEEQSKRLLALGLKAETADMSYQIHYFDLDGILLECVHTLEPDPPFNNDRYIPAWSFHRLIQIANAMFDETAENWYDDIIDTIQSFILLGCLNEEYLNMDIVNAVRENYNMKLFKNEKDS